jgi:hypothetical protein
VISISTPTLTVVALHRFGERPQGREDPHRPVLFRLRRLDDARAVLRFLLDGLGYVDDASVEVDDFLPTYPLRGPNAAHGLAKGVAQAAIKPMFRALCAGSGWYDPCSA